jgi:ribosomal protein uL24
MPVRKDDEVLIMRGKYKKREGKVTQVYRKKYIIHVQGVAKEKANGRCLGPRPTATLCVHAPCACAVHVVLSLHGSVAGER